MNIYFDDLGINRNQLTHDQNTAPVNNQRLPINDQLVETINNVNVEPAYEIIHNAVVESIHNHGEEISRSSATLTLATTVDRNKAMNEFHCTNKYSS